MPGRMASDGPGLCCDSRVPNDNGAVETTSNDGDDKLSEAGVAVCIPGRSSR